VAHKPPGKKPVGTGKTCTHGKTISSEQKILFRYNDCPLHMLFRVQEGKNCLKILIANLLKGTLGIHINGKST
jgi:hypothetical protein